MKTLLGIILLCGASLASAQQIQPVKIPLEHIDDYAPAVPDKPKGNEDEKVYTMVEVKPEFPGGQEAFFKYVAKNFIIPEESAQFVKVLISFIVEKDGSFTDIKVLRDNGYGTGREAIRVIKSSPKWKPGLQNGKPVRVQYTVPISIVNSK